MSQVSSPEELHHAWNSTVKLERYIKGFRRCYDGWAAGDGNIFIQVEFRNHSVHPGADASCEELTEMRFHQATNSRQTGPHSRYFLRLMCIIRAGGQDGSFRIHFYLVILLINGFWTGKEGTYSYLIGLEAAVEIKNIRYGRSNTYIPCRMEMTVRGFMGLTAPIFDGHWL